MHSDFINQFWEFRLIWQGGIVASIYSMPKKHKYFISHIGRTVRQGETHRYIYDEEATKQLDQPFVRIFTHPSK